MAERGGGSTEQEHKRAASLPWMEHASRAGALLVGTTYVLGFLIITLHNAKFGIADFGLIRARIFTAGMSFLILTGVPAAAMLRMIPQVKTLRITSSQAGQSPHTWHILLVVSVLVTSFFAASFNFALGLSFLLGDMPKPDPAGGLLFVIWFVFNFFVAVSVAIKLETEPIACLVLSALSVAGLAIIVVESFNAIFLLRISWFFAVGLETLFLSFALRDPHWRRTAEWEKHVIPLLFLALFYARWIYGNISVSWGGGKPIHAVFYYVGKPLPLSTDGTEVWLVDETDSGYYFLKSEQDAGVFFVRRGEVAEIRYKKGNH